MAERQRPWAADGDDYDNWFRWLAAQDRELKSSIVGSLWDLDDTVALYAIMCRLADGERASE